MKPRTIKIGKSSTRLLDTGKKSGKKATPEHEDQAA